MFPTFDLKMLFLFNPLLSHRKLNFLYICVYAKKNCVFATNSNLLIPISLQPNGVIDSSNLDSFI